MINLLKRATLILPAAAAVFCLLLLPGRGTAADFPEKLAVSGDLSGITVQTVRESAPEVPFAAAPGAVEVSVAGSAGTLKVSFVDVGQGDAEYLELPDGKTVLIDGGPDKREGGPSDSSHPATDPPLAHFLLQKGIAKIDRVVLTHPHSDHYVGLRYVFSKLPVSEFYDTKADNPGTGDDEVRAQAAAVPGIRVYYPKPGDYLDWGPDVQARVLNSCPDASVNPVKNINNCSIVIKLTYQNSSILFTGDMQADVEAQVVAKFGAELRSDVLKVGHHGSAGSSSDLFLNAVKPKLAFIEVGANNSYGHPREVALARLRAAGARIYRTDLDGTQEYLPGNLAQFLARP